MHLMQLTRDVDGTHRVVRVVFFLFSVRLRRVTHTQHTLPLAMEHLRRSTGRKSIHPRVHRHLILLYHTSCGFYCALFADVRSHLPAWHLTS